MRLIWVVAAVAAATATVRAVDVAMDRASVDAAVTLGQSRTERERLRYHADYRFSINKPPIDYVEIVTPFRRLVLAAEARALVGDRRFGQRQALELLAAAGGQLDVRVELTFHPLNTYVGVPEYTIRLVTGEASPARAAVTPLSVESIPRYGARVDGTPVFLPAPGGAGGEKSQPLLGGTVVAHFEGGAFDANGRYDVTIQEAGKELGRVGVDFGRVR
jgi:hypothetical protein